MASVNRVLLIGHLGKDPEVRNLPNGGTVTTFSLAASDNWKSQAGDRQERTVWHNVVIWNEAVGEVANRYAKKGSQVCVEGSIENREFTDREGIKRTVTEIVIRPFAGNLTLLDKADRPARQQRRGAAPEPGGRR